MGTANPQAVDLARGFKKKAEKKYHLKKVILFGSQATGTPREGSDIDLLIVTDELASRSGLMSELLTEWHLIQKKTSPVDFLPYTEREFEEASKRITIVRQALDEGTEI